MIVSLILMVAALSYLWVLVINRLLCCHSLTSYAQYFQVCTVLLSTNQGPVCIHTYDALRLQCVTFWPFSGVASDCAPRQLSFPSSSFSHRLPSAYDVFLTLIKAFEIQRRTVRSYYVINVHWFMASLYRFSRPAPHQLQPQTRITGNTRHGRAWLVISGWGDPCPSDVYWIVFSWLIWFFMQVNGWKDTLTLMPEHEHIPMTFSNNLCSCYFTLHDVSTILLPSRKWISFSNFLINIIYLSFFKRKLMKIMKCIHGLYSWHYQTKGSKCRHFWITGHISEGLFCIIKRLSHKWLYVHSHETMYPACKV